MSVKVHEGYCLDSQQDRLLWFDDFLGDQIQDEWHEAGTGSAAVVDAQTGGIVRITTGAVNLDNYSLYWNNIRSLLVTKKVSIEYRVKLSRISNIEVLLRLLCDANNNILFSYTEAAGGGPSNWQIITEDGGVSTSQDSGIAGNTNYHIFRTECHTHGASHVHFYIDGVETGNSPITTNIPDDATDYLQPWIYLRNRAGAAATTDVDYVTVRQEI